MNDQRNNDLFLLPSFRWPLTLPATTTSDSMAKAILAGEEIPLSARIVAIADVYDALRSKRIYKPALPHADALRIMVKEDAGHFDPFLLAAFQRCCEDFERSFQQLTD